VTPATPSAESVPALDDQVLDCIPVDGRLVLPDGATVQRDGDYFVVIPGESEDGKEGEAAECAKSADKNSLQVPAPGPGKATLR
jgi:hypothetical protein